MYKLKRSIELTIYVFVSPNFNSEPNHLQNEGHASTLSPESERNKWIEKSGHGPISIAGN